MTDASLPTPTAFLQDPNSCLREGRLLQDWTGSSTRIRGCTDSFTVISPKPGMGPAHSRCLMNMSQWREFSSEEFSGRSDLRYCFEVTLSIQERPKVVI